MANNLTIGDGQVASGTPAQIASSPGSSEATRLNVSLANVGGQDETLILTIVRGTGTPRRYKRVVLAADEQIEICGLPLNPTDSLQAVTTNANSIDYLVSVASANAPQTFAVYDSYGGVKTAPYILDQLANALS